MKKMLMIVILIFLAQNSCVSDRYHIGYEDIQKTYQGRIWYPISPSIKEDAIPGSPIFKALYAKAVTAFALAHIEFFIELTIMRRKSTSTAFGTGSRRIDEVVASGYKSQ